MVRLLRRKGDVPKRSLWQRIKDVALMDVAVLARGGVGAGRSSSSSSAARGGFRRAGDAAPRRGSRARVPTRQGEDAGRIPRRAAEGIDAALRAGKQRSALDMSAAAPTVILVVGVNGAGKTTFIGKLATRFAREGKRVMVAAGDTFRAGAIDQLRVWAERTGAEFVGSNAGADPAAVAFDAIDAAVARGVDVLIIDTAGRLHTSDGLMDELKKVARVIAKRLPGAPHETLLVLDGTIGQNAVQQAKIFRRGRAGDRPRRHEARRHGARRRRRRRARGDRRAGEVPGRRRAGGRSRSVRRRRRSRGSCWRRSERDARAGAGASVSTRASPISRASGPQRAEALRRLGIVTAGDLLFHVPHRYEDASTVAPIASLEPGMHGTVHRHRHLQGRDPDAQRAADLPGGASRRSCDDRSVMARPAVSRSHDQQGRRAAGHGHRALLPRPPASAARVHQPRSGRRGRRSRDACCRCIRPPKDCRSS